MNFFEPKETQFDGIYIKPMTIKQSLSISHIKDDNDRFFTPAIYCLCDKDGNQMFDNLDDFYNYFPSTYMNDIVELIINVNTKDTKEDDKSAEKNVI